jgi:hypothetical protein
MATTPHGFPRLPWELRNKIWKEHLPKYTIELSRALASHLLGLTAADTFWRSPKSYHTGSSLLLLIYLQRHSSPYQELAACAESRVLALTQVKKELENDSCFSNWLRKPPYPFTPKLELDTRRGELIYTCPQTVRDYSLGKYVFWEHPAVTMTTTHLTNTSSPLRERGEDDEWNPDDDEIPEIDGDIEWSDYEHEEEEKGVKRSREEDVEERSPHKRQKSQETIFPEDQGTMGGNQLYIELPHSCRLLCTMY